MAVVVAPRLDRVVVIAGTPETPVRHLRFQGLDFAHTDFPLPAFGYNGIQATHHGTTMKGNPVHVQPVAVECAWAEDCRFERCRFAHLNNSGIGFGPGCRNNAILGCLIEDIGGNGAMIGWRGTGQRTHSGLEANWANPADAPVSNVYKIHGKIVAFNQNSRGSHKWAVNFLGDEEAKAEAVQAIIDKAGIEPAYRE